MGTKAYEEVLSGAERLLAELPHPVYLVDAHGGLLWGNRAYRQGAGARGYSESGTAAGAGGTWMPEGVRAPIRAEDGELLGYTVSAPQPAPRGGDAEEWHRIVAEHTSDTIVLVDEHSVVRFVSPSLRHMTGYGTDQYLGMDAFDIIHPDDRDRVRAVHRDVVAFKRPCDQAYRVVHADGRTVYVESKVKPVLDAAGGVKYVVASARDVTQRKKTEQLLEHILENVNAAVVSTDSQFSRYTYCSDSIEKITGMKKEEVMQHPIRLHDAIHRDDHALLMGEARSRLDRGQPVNVAVRMVHVEGETRWGQVIFHPWINHRGEIERLDGMLMDITDKRRAELALEESEQRYKSLFENNLDGVFSIELDGFYLVNANPAFEELTGVELERLSDRCFLGLVYDEDHSAVYEALFKVMGDGKPTDIECRLMDRRSGERIASITFVPIFLAGRLNGIHGIVKDITRRKSEERELVDSERRYRFLQQSLSRFASDLSRVMKVSELERRLVEEVRAVLDTAEAAVEEVPRGQIGADEGPGVLRIRIGERRHPVYLHIVLRSEPLPIEREWLGTVVHYVTILYDNLHLIEDLLHRLEKAVAANETPQWMLRLLFRLSEKERATLSSDLHDTVLQDLIIWYRKLESLRSLRSFEEGTERELRQIEEGLLDAIHQIRITCNELRPPFLLKMGLEESLRSLFEYTRMFANYEIDFAPSPLPGTLHEEQILGIYRIVQELLNNANKHSRASKVTVALTGADDGESIVFAYADDGVGMELSGLEGSFRHMGIAGIEKRVESLGGTIDFRSAPGRGFHADIQFPAHYR